ncbi:MAG: ankyrin repeat domain-containing protein [Chloroflexota bacterium]|nr:ankyrin repeat domain-containing protein [Chloroflexota bacterium]
MTHRRSLLPILTMFIVAFITIGCSESKGFGDREFWETATADDVRKAIERGESINDPIGPFGSGFPLHQAVDHATDVDAIRVLLIRGARVDAKTRLIGQQTPLHWTVNRSEYQIRGEIMKLLLEHGANVEARDEYGNTPLHSVGFLNIENLEERGHPSFVEILLNYGADIHARNDNGDTPLHRAHKPEIAKALLNYGANVNERNEEGLTPLHRKGAEITLLLLDYGADIEAQAYWSGLTPLHYAVIRRDLTAAEALLDSGANINAIDDIGQTALHHAVGPEHEPELAIVELLLKRGIDRDARDESGNTPCLLSKAWHENAELHRLLCE